MSVDADRVVNLCASLHELWSLPAQIAIALYLLYTQVTLDCPHALYTQTYLQITINRPQKLALYGTLIQSRHHTLAVSASSSFVTSVFAMYAKLLSLVVTVANHHTAEIIGLPTFAHMASVVSTSQGV